MHTDDAREQGFERELRRSLAEPAAGPAGGCVDAETVAAWSEGSLSPLQAAAVELHLSSCLSCQALLATFVRTAPAQPAAAPTWRRWQLQWLLPLATATAALTIWLTIPGRTPAIVDSVREDRPLAQASAPSSPVVPSPDRERSARLTQPAAIVPGELGAPRSATPAATAAPPQRPTAPAGAMAKALQHRLKKEAEADGRVAAIADAALKPTAETSARAAAERARVALEERSVAEATAAAPPPPPPAAAAASRPMTPVPAPPATTDRQGPLAGLARSQAFRGSSVDVISPTSATRWRIGIDGRVDYFGQTAPSGRPVDIPVATPILAGSSPLDDVCWMVGRGGAVYLTSDGIHFTRIAFPDAVDLVAVRAVDGKIAAITAAGGRTYRTTDAGKSWQ